MSNNSNKFIQQFIKKVFHSDLDKLQLIFKNTNDENGEEIGLDEHGFTQIVCFLNVSGNTNKENNVIFKQICKNQDIGRITWHQFLDFIIDNVKFDSKIKLRLETIGIESVPHSKNETVNKIVIIETIKYFCYVIILKHGRVGLYDGNLNFLTSYQLIMTEEDLIRPENERRRRNRWVTDALFDSNLYLLIITTSTRSIIIYEASGLKHIPYWLILSTPNIIECISYKSIDKFDKSVLFAGDSNGDVISLTFLQAKDNFLRKKKNKDITVFYWKELLKEINYVFIKKHKKNHVNSIKNIEYIEEGNLLLSSSEDSEKSLIVKYLNNKKESTVYKVENGVTCFALNISNNILITGSKKGKITLWNFLISKPIINLSNHKTSVVDLKILENQNLFFSCSYDGILNLWDLKEFICVQTLKINFPSFHIHGKSIEWSKSCIYPGPQRYENDKKYKEKDFEINSEFDGETAINKTKLNKKLTKNIWERSMILIVCCNYIAKIRMHFHDASIEYSFTLPILPSPPLQNSVLIPFNWNLQGSSIDSESYFQKKHGINVKSHLQDLSFILDRNILQEQDKESDINYKIALLEEKKYQMKSKVALGAPYLALDLNTIEEIKLPETLPPSIKRKHKQIPEKIRNILQNATNKDEIFSLPDLSGSSTSRSRVSSSIGQSFY